MKVIFIGMLFSLVQFPEDRPKQRKQFLAHAILYGVSITVFSYSLGIGLAILPQVLFQSPGWLAALSVDGIFLGLVLGAVFLLRKVSRQGNPLKMKLPPQINRCADS